MFDRRLQQILDRRQRPDDDAALQAHALVCDRCDRVFRSQRRLFAGLEASRPIGPRPSVAPAVVGHFVVARHQQRFRQFLNALAFTIPMAAVVLIAVVPVFWHRTGGGTQSPVSSVPIGAEAGAVAPSVAAVRQPPAAWPFNALTGAYAARFASSDPADGLQHTVRRWYRELDPERGLESVQELTGGLKPIATTVNAAIGTIWKTIPKAPPAATPGSTSAA
jgi:hypothetical protein